MTPLADLTNGELDALVATEVMGWAAREAYFDTGNNVINLWWFNGNDERQHRVSSWSPSTSIADAWEVVIKVYELGLGWMLVGPNHDGSKWEAYQATGCADPDFGEWFETAATPCRAICLAALRAKGVGDE